MEKVMIVRQNQDFIEKDLEKLNNYLSKGFKYTEYNILKETNNILFMLAKKE